MIHIKKVIQKKAPFLLYLPGVLQCLRSILHEKDINNCLKFCGDVQGIEFIDSVLKFFEVHAETVCKEVLPEDRYIFVANHPMGGLDGLAFVSAIHKLFPKCDPRILVNSILLLIENFKPTFISIDKHRRQSRKSTELINHSYASDQQMLLFPAGTVSIRDKGQIVDESWQHNFVKKAIHYQRNIVPVYIGCKNTDRFYTCANIRRSLGISFDVESIFLPDEMFKQRGKPIQITIGEPISYSNFKNISASVGADIVRQEVYKLSSL
jgi:putative hemolysin